jgi:hypothetical protein
MSETTEEDKKKLAAFQLFLAATPLMQKVIKDVGNERLRQLEKWGKQRYDPGPWLAILGEEFGEVCEASALIIFGQGKETDANDLYTELIHLAAVSVAWAEQLRESQEGGGPNDQDAH